MYTSFPKKDRLAIRISLTTAWAFTALGGVGGAFITPTTVSEEIGYFLPIVSSLFVLVFSVLAMFGVATNRYQFEWIGAWFVAGGSFAYVATVWYFVFADTPMRLQPAASLTSLIGFYVYRLIACAAHAKKQRRIHEMVHTGETGAIDAQ